MYTYSLEQAEQILRAYPEYSYFLDNPTQWWNVQQVAEGLGIGDSVVRNWCEDQSLSGSVKYPGNTGWRIPRTSLIRYLAQRHMEMQQGKRAREA